MDGVTEMKDIFNKDEKFRPGVLDLNENDTGLEVEGVSSFLAAKEKEGAKHMDE